MIPAAMPPSPARRPARAALAALALVTPGCLVLHGSPEAPAVRSLRLEGAKAVPAAEILERLATRPSDRAGWGEERAFDADVFAVDLRRVEAAYRTRGFFRARVTGSEAKEVRRGRVVFGDDLRARVEGEDHLVDLVIRVEEGPPVRVGEVRLEGLEAEPGALAPLGRAPLERLPLRTGQIFREDRYDEAREAIEKALTANGYPRPEVEQRAEVDPAAGRAAVTYTVRSGGRFRFGNVFVSGAAQVARSTLRDLAGDEVEPGSWYDATRLPRVQARVHDLGVFGGIRVSAGKPDPERGTVPILLSVREAPFRTIRLGPSLGIEAARWDASMTAGWTHRNFQGGLRKLKLDLRLGYSWIKTPFQPSAEGLSGLASADFTQPEVIGRKVDLSARVEGERRIEDGYSYFVERVRVGLPVKLFAPVLTFFPSANVEYYQTRGQATQVQVGAATQTLLSCAGASTCLLPFLEQRIDLDLRDDALATTRGLYLSAALQEGLRPFGQGFRYLRLVPELRAFVRLGKAVLAARGRVGVVRAYAGDPLPIVARVSSGGPGQMRGYYTRRLSPVVALANGGFAPVGGEASLDGSLEVRFPLSGHLGGALFLDGGNAFLSAADLWKVDRLQWAPGLGLRYDSPFGPVRFDVAGRLPTRSGGRWLVPGVPVVTLGPDGGLVDTGTTHAEPLIGFHLSIGEAF
jgi:translocation and assembly module TamA